MLLIESVKMGVTTELLKFESMPSTKVDPRLARHTPLDTPIIKIEIATCGEKPPRTRARLIYI